MMGNKIYGYQYGKIMVDKYSKFHKIMGKDIYGKQMGMQFSQMAALHLKIFFSSYIHTHML